MPASSTSHPAGDLKDAKNTSPGAQSLLHGSTVDCHALRARCFPAPRMQPQVSPHPSRRPTERYDVSLSVNRSIDGIHDHTVNGLLHSVGTTPPPVVDPFMTIICPENQDAGDEASESLSKTGAAVSQRDNFGRTQVRVEGYFRDGDDAPGVLIPNDLPRSTFLYVLTASEGRDKLFKCLQYALHLAICILKRPSFLPLDSQEFADYWANRLWRNCNTIRHGRSLFKLGRWLMNLFYLEEVLERLALKYGNLWNDLLEAVSTFISRLMHLPPRRKGQLRYGGRQKSLSHAGSIDAVSTAPMESLVTDDMYTHIARAEFPWQQPTVSRSMSSHRNMAEGSLGKSKKEMGGRAAAAAAAAAVESAASTLRLHKKDKFHGAVPSATMGVGHTLRDSGEAARVKMEQNEYRCCSSEVLTEPVVPCEPLSLPPSVQSTLPASFGLYNGHHHHHHQQQHQQQQQQQQEGKEGLLMVSTTKLLRPMHTTVGDDNNNSHNNTNNNNDNGNMQVSNLPQKVSLKSNTSRAAGYDKPSSPRSYLNLYQMLPYEPRLGNALPSPRVTGISNHQSSASKVQTNRLISSTAVDDDMDVEPFELQHAMLNDSEVSLTSSCGGEFSQDEKKNSDCPCAIPAEMGQPARWRKRMLEFSTPLILLLGMRSVATIGRRVLRDILLLSSEHFLNLSYVEKNRPLLQRHTNWMWMVVASIDLLLNTIRLLNPGWYRYTTVRDNARYHCGCSDPDAGDAVWRYRHLVARRQANLFFPSVDLDFGAPICSSPAYLEAADPERIAPACRTCGFLFVERQVDGDDNAPPHSQHRVEGMGHGGRITRNGNPVIKPMSIGDKAEVAILLIPWLMRRLFNYLWLLRTHPNWTATVLLQVRYMTEVYLAFMYCVGGYETGKSDSALEDMLHPSGAIAGLIGAVIGLHRVIESAPH